MSSFYFGRMAGLLPLNRSRFSHISLPRRTWFSSIANATASILPSTAEADKRASNLLQERSLHTSTTTGSPSLASMVTIDPLRIPTDPMLPPLLLPTTTPLIFPVVEPTAATNLPKEISKDHAVISTMDMFSVGIGPSSSHTVGPMRAAKQFLETLEQHGYLIDRLGRLQVDLYGSLALTGEGHGTVKAIALGLLGFDPEHVEPASVDGLLSTLKLSGNLSPLNRHHAFPFTLSENVNLNKTVFLPKHSNAVRFSIYKDTDGSMLATQTFYSIGGGFILTDGLETESGLLLLRSASREPESAAPEARLPFLFSRADELLALCEKHQCDIATIVEANEVALAAEKQRPVREATLQLWHVMNASIQAGCDADPAGYLPGILRVKRRAPMLYKKLLSESATPSSGRMPGLDWLSLYALAVNEENACGGRVVTAPTNGAAGVIPSVLKYFMTFMSSDVTRGDRELTDHVICQFLWTASAIGMLYKKGASLSAAEVGCQGEVGVASSMAAGALTAVLGGTPAQVENAAEIAMEHHLGLTCDPIAGLVQIPCIERNALGAVKALTASQLALHGDGQHRVSLDQCIAAMKQTGLDMSTKYKETSLAGLAVNVPIC